MDLDSVRIRPDGKVVAIRKHPNNPLIFVEVPESPEHVSGQTDWPVEELCDILELAHEQGLTREAIEEIRKHRGSWDEIDIFTMANIIGLRPGSREHEWLEYPSLYSGIHEGMIFLTVPPLGTHLQEQLGTMPRQGLTKSDVERLGKFQIQRAYGVVGGITVDYMQCGQHKVDFTRLPNGEWEYFPLHPWENVHHIRLSYKSNRIACGSWEQWRLILKAFAERKDWSVDDLAVVTQTKGYFNLHKRHCPELGLRPIYFFRKPNPKTATPREFWGFFSFNPDPTAPTGISFRWDTNQLGCLVSDGMPLHMPLRSTSADGSEPERREICFVVNWLTTMDDWHHRIRGVLEGEKGKFDAEFAEEDLVWSDDEDDNRDNPCFRGA
ncbi:hypothetical protein FRC12_015640 [Ceratobasidium sp. 428]|nr:hypothetical protein FRC12_015640 [Ceratobasidium sp. 428]